MSGEQETFATDCDVFLKGQEVDDSKVIAFTIELDFNQPGMAMLTLRNDVHTSNDYGPGDPVEIKVGPPGGTKVSIFKGEIWGMQPQYKAGGDSKVTIQAFDKSRRMLQGKKSKTYQQMSDQDIVGQVVGPYSLTASSGSDPKITHEQVYQHAQDDLSFVRLRAARLGYQVWCEDTTLHFKKPDPTADSGIVLNLDERTEHHLKTFHAWMSATNIVNKVTVRGWDHKKKEEVVGEATPSGSRLGKTQAHSAAGTFGSAVTYTVDHPIASVAEAQAIAKAKLDEHLMSYITAQAECRGHSAYKLGIVVKIVVNNDDATKDNDRFNGKYMINGVTHRYTHGTGGNQSGGFVSLLRLSRDAEKPP